MRRKRCSDEMLTILDQVKCNVIAYDCVFKSRSINGLHARELGICWCYNARVKFKVEKGINVLSPHPTAAAAAFHVVKSIGGGILAGSKPEVSSKARV